MPERFKLINAFAIVFFPFIFIILMVILENLPLCIKASSSIYISQTCSIFGSVILNTFGLFFLLITAIFAYICSFFFAARKTNDEIEKFRKVIKKDVILAIVFSIIFSLPAIMAIEDVAAKYENEAKILIIPVLLYAQSQGWESLHDNNNPAEGDSSIPNYNKVFVTKQTPDEVEQQMLSLLNKEGYHMNAIQVTPENSYENNSSDLGFPYTKLDGTSANGNEVEVDINDKGDPEANDPTAQSASRMTYVEVDFSGTYIQMQK